VASNITDTTGSVSWNLTEYEINGSITYTNDCSDATGNINCSAPYTFKIFPNYYNCLEEWHFWCASSEITDPVNTTMGISQVVFRYNQDKSTTAIIGNRRGVKQTYDTYIDNYTASIRIFNYGITSTFEVGNITNSLTMGILKFDFSEVPYDANITCANFSLYQTTGGNKANIEMDRLMINWTEGNLNGATPTTDEGVTFNNSRIKTGLKVPWFSELKDSKCDTIDACDIWTESPIAVKSIDIGLGMISNFSDCGGNITNLVRGWINGTYKNYGVILKSRDTTGSAQNKRFASSETTLYASPLIYITYFANQTIKSTVEGTTPNSPFAINIQYLAGWNGSSISGGKLINKLRLFAPGTKFRFINISNSNNRNDIATGTGTNNINTTLFCFANNSVSWASGTTGSGIDGWKLGNNDVIDANNDGKDEIATTGDDGSAPISYIINSTGATLWQTLGQSGDSPFGDVNDYDQDGRNELLRYNIGTSITANLTLYDNGSTRNILWTVTQPSSNLSDFVNEVKFEPNMYGGGQPEVAIGYGLAGTAKGNYGYSVYNASNGTRIYNVNVSATGILMLAMDSVDGNKDGYKDLWVGITNNNRALIANKSMGSPYLTNALQGSVIADEIVVGDFNGDGYENDFAVVETNAIMAYNVNITAAITQIWNYTTIYLSNNLTGASGWRSNSMKKSDVNGDGVQEIIFLAGSGYMAIVNASGYGYIDYFNPELYFTGIGTTIVSAPRGYGKAQALDTSMNVSDGTHILGFTTMPNEATTINGYMYAYEVEPCKIRIDGGSVRAMYWNTSTQTYRLYNSTGLDSGNHYYNVTCTGELDGYGTKTFNGTFTITGGAPSISFTVFTLGGGGNLTNSMNTNPGNYTEAIYFNATGCTGITCMYQQWIRPCANADASTYCQNGANNPIFSYWNTGTSTFTLVYNVKNAITTGAKMCVNTTASDGATAYISQCVIGNLNNSVGVELGSMPEMSWLNATIYMNFSYLSGGSYSNELLHNATG
jgi:hypothetical protein